MVSNEAVIVENAVSNLYSLQFITIGISTFFNEHFQLVQFHLKPSERLIVGNSKNAFFERKYSSL